MSRSKTTRRLKRYNGSEGCFDPGRVFSLWFSRRYSTSVQHQVDCQGEEDDRCGTLTFTVDSSDSSIDVMIKNCTRSAIDCDQDAVCERVRTHVENHGGTLSDCSSSCCNSDNCNAPADKKSKRMGPEEITYAELIYQDRYHERIQDKMPSRF
ncbi:hypothetical protein ACROYT_G005112 [Oculina patagonica]